MQLVYNGSVMKKSMCSLQECCRNANVAVASALENEFFGIFLAAAVTRGWLSGVTTLQRR
jgi:hypothetical protein